MRPKSETDIDSDLLKDFNKSHIISLIIGMFPLRLAESGFKVSGPGLACSLFMLTFLSVCISSKLLTSQKDYYMKPTSTQQIFFYFDYGALNVAILIRLWSTLRQRKRFMSLLRVVSKVKRFLDVAGIPWRPKQTFLASVIHSALFLSSISFHHLTSDITASSASYYFLVWTVIWIFTDFMWFAENLAEGFRCLTFSLHRATTAGDVEFLLKCHYLLTEASTRLDDACSTALFFTYFSSFSLIFFCVYDVIVSVVVGSSLTTTLATLFWAILLVVLFIRIVNSASHVYYQAKRFDVILYRLLVYKRPTNITQNNTTLKLFLHFSAKTDVIFTLSGFFKLDWSLLYSMMAAGCTYLIVIVQMNYMT